MYNVVEVQTVKGDPDASLDNLVNALLSIKINEATLITIDKLQILTALVVEEFSAVSFIVTAGTIFAPVDYFVATSVNETEETFRKSKNMRLILKQMIKRLSERRLEELKDSKAYTAEHDKFFKPIKKNVFQKLKDVILCI